ncbi:hypothetical protein LINGRAHAP2_LOCUS24439, partial [Linum grandiflorum]
VYVFSLQNHKHCAKLNKVAFPCYAVFSLCTGKHELMVHVRWGWTSCVRKCRVLQLRYQTTYCWDGSQLNLINQQNQLVCRTRKPSLWLLMMMSPRQHRPIKHNNPTLQAVQKRFDVKIKSAPATEDVDELKPILKAAVDNLQSMTGQFDQTNNLKDNLFREVQKVEGISTDDAVDAAFKLIKDADLLRLFYSMSSTEACKGLIQRVLRDP